MKATFFKFTEILYFIYLGFTLIFLSCSKNTSKSSTSTSFQDKLPVLATTIPATEITQFTATTGANILSEGGAIITRRGVCYSKSPNPTINDFKTIDAAGTGEFKSVINNLELNTTYYIRAYATNKYGTAYGLQIQIKTLQPNVGTIWGGGTVVYIFNNNDKGYVSGEVHGLIVGDKIIGDFPFGCDNKRINYNYGRGTPIPPNIGGLDDDIAKKIGYGEENTKAILKSCNAKDIAAYACDTLSLNGFNDWFLPSSDELEVTISSMFPDQKNYFLVSKLNLPEEGYYFLCSNDFTENLAFLKKQIKYGIYRVTTEYPKKYHAVPVLPMRKF